MTTVENPAHKTVGSLNQTYYVTVSYPGHGPLKANIPVVATSPDEAREKAIKMTTERLSAWIS